MRKLIWLYQPEMALFSGEQQRILQQAFGELDYDVQASAYRPRMIWRQREKLDLLVWSFVPSQLDVWSARLHARTQIGVIHELSTYERSLPQLGQWLVPAASLRSRLLKQGAERVDLVNCAPLLKRSSCRDVRSTLRLKADTPLIFAGGPLIPQTGTRIAIWALNILNYLHPEVQLIIHGTGCERERLESFIQSIDHRARTHILPESWPVAEIVAQVDQVWIPQAWDGVPDVLYAALQAGRPIVAAQQPAFSAWLTHEHNAVLVPHDQAPPWASAANRLLIDPISAARLGKAARATPLQQAPTVRELGLHRFMNKKTTVLAA